MEGRLTNPQIDYVLEHLAHHVTLTPDLRSLFRIGADKSGTSPEVYFPLHENSFDPREIVRIDSIPVLYAHQDHPGNFYSIRDHDLVFHHDLLKSIFYLLSGYQEQTSTESDQYGRYPYTSSIQYKLGITWIPLVNYYMEVIIQGLHEFCKINRVRFKRKTVFENPVLALSHDIDRIHANDFFETAFKFKQLLGLAPSPYSLKDKIDDTVETLCRFLNPFSRKDPFWSFEFLHQTEKERGFRSTYFFLEKNGRKLNSRYRFSDKKIRKVIADLSEKGHEIGLHGTIQSAADEEALQKTLDNLNKVSPNPVKGIRQHYLKYKPGITSDYHERAGLVYDTTLGFAEHEGFRHSYCWPFRLYDIKQDRELDIWEIPLTVMEGTLFYYRNHTLSSARESIESLVNEVVKFNGVFSLLWHNSFFDEREFPGIRAFYLELLDYFMSRQMEGLTGSDIIDRIRNA